MQHPAHRHAPFVRQWSFAVLARVGSAAVGEIIMGELFQPSHLLFVGLGLLIFFGGRKLPELGKGLGEGLKGFKEGLKGVTDEPNANTKPGETAHIVTPKPDETPKV
jgi:sec-independent protein translocase protein TatA